MKPKQLRAATERQKLRAAERLRVSVRKNAHRLLDGFLKSLDPESRMPMIDVLSAHVALGYGFTVGVRVEHPQADSRVAEDPSVTAQLAEPKSVIEIAR